MKRTIGGCSVALGVVLLSALAVTVPAGEASANSSCTLGLCSETTNQTNRQVGTARDWCSGNNGPCGNSPYGVLQPGQTTPSGQDWDAFFVASGCTYSGIKHSYGGSFSVTAGSNGKWVRVHNDEHYYIKKITC